MRGDPGEGSPKTLRRPKFLRLPMYPLVAVDENAKEYPQKYHWNIPTALLAETAQINDRADFLLAKPEYRKARFSHTCKSKPQERQTKVARHSSLTETRNHEGNLSKMFNNPLHKPERV